MISYSLNRGGTGQETEHYQENVFRTPRHSLLRDQIFSLINKSFHLSPSGEIIGLMPPRVALARFSEPPWAILEFLPPGVLVVLSPFEGQGPPWVESSEEEAT